MNDEHKQAITQVQEAIESIKEVLLWVKRMRRWVHSLPDEQAIILIESLSANAKSLLGRRYYRLKTRYNRLSHRPQQRSSRGLAVQHKRKQLGLPVDGTIRFWTRKASYEVAESFGNADEVAHYAERLQNMHIKNRS